MVMKIEETVIVITVLDIIENSLQLNFVDIMNKKWMDFLI